MKKIIILLSFGALFAGAAQAQTVESPERKARQERRPEGRQPKQERNQQDRKQKKSPEELAARQTRMLDQKLGLSSRQERQVQEINLRQIQAMQALQTKYAGSNDRKAGGREEIKAIRENWENDLEKILSKKQFAQYEATRKEMKAGHAQKGEKGRKMKEKRQQNS